MVKSIYGNLFALEIRERFLIYVLSLPFKLASLQGVNEVSDEACLAGRQAICA
ncbi:MAG: hypothetical protein V1933_03175 [Candidatus Omnitrophota bacterium]